MNLSVDTSFHIAEIIAFAVVLGKLLSDVNWLKKEVQHLRQLCEINFGIRKG